MGWKFRKKKKDIPGGVWLKCQGCNSMLTRKKVEQMLGTCPECGFHFKIDGRRRIEQLLDEGSFEEFGSDIAPVDHLDFFDKEPYTEKLNKTQGKTGLSEAATVGRGRMDGLDVVLGVLDFSFMGGSMGVVVGERVTLAAEVAREEQRALVLVSTSGGARMHEGALSLMQMAKTSVALGRLGEAGIPYVSVLADPCTGGVIASFAALGDIILAEPGALIGFAGPRVIATTIRTKLPEGFQRAEFLLEHGMVDRIVDRRELKLMVSRLLQHMVD